MDEEGMPPDAANPANWGVCRWFLVGGECTEGPNCSRHHDLATREEYLQKRDARDLADIVYDRDALARKVRGDRCAEWIVNGSCSKGDGCQRVHARKAS
jgi:hypothetical protein